MNHAIVVARPPGQAQQLILLFHGWAGEAADLLPLGRELAAAFPQACVVSVQAPDACGDGPGYQWFAVRGLDDPGRVERVAEAMPEFLATVAHWQRETGTTVAQTALIGFSQGAVMALEATRDRASPAGRVVALAGRFARLPTRPSAEATLHLLHGKRDAVMPYGLTIEAAEHLVRLGADVTADVLPFVGHEPDERMIALLLHRLRTHVPLRLWREAMASDPGRCEGPAH